MKKKNRFVKGNTGHCLVNNQSAFDYFDLLYEEVVKYIKTLINFKGLFI